jgi:hypothetical protein
MKSRKELLRGHSQLTIRESRSIFAKVIAAFFRRRRSRSFLFSQRVSSRVVTFDVRVRFFIIRKYVNTLMGLNIILPIVITDLILRRLLQILNTVVWLL